MTERPIDLVEIFRIIRINRRFIIRITLGAMLLTLIICLVKPKKYQGMTEFYIANPLNSERSNIFKKDYPIMIDYFGNENTVDKVMSMAKSDAVIDAVAEKLDLYTYYQFKKEVPKDVNALRVLFKKNREVTRTEYYTIEVGYTDKQAEKAAEIANEIVKQTNLHLVSFFDDIKSGITNGLKAKSLEIDSTIYALSDSVAMPFNSAGGRGNAQNYAAIKDQLILDRAHYASIINEYGAASNSNSIPLLHTVYEAVPPVKPHGLGWLLTTIVAGLATLFFTILYLLLRHYYRMVDHQV